MSRIEAVAPPIVDVLEPSVPRRRGSALAWMTFACALLAASGVARSWQDGRHQVEAEYIEDCPFKLKTLPTTVGGWKMAETGDLSLDSDTMRITGGTEHLMRSYFDEMTGVSLVVLVLFGPVEPVIPHTPEVCYPANGFKLVEDYENHTIRSAEEGGVDSVFRSAVYAMSGGRSFREGVYYSFRLEGNWTPDPGAGRKFPRKNPSVFKVQVQRRVADGERRDRQSKDPIEDFLSHFVPAIERAIKGSETKKPNTTSVGELGASRAGIELASATPDHSGIPGHSRGRSIHHRGRGLRQAGDEDRGTANQPDQQEDRGQVNRERDMDGGPDGVARLDGPRT